MMDIEAFFLKYLQSVCKS